MKRVDCVSIMRQISNLDRIPVSETVQWQVEGDLQSAIDSDLIEIWSGINHPARRFTTRRRFVMIRPVRGEVLYSMEDVVLYSMERPLEVYQG
jgi:hypothetical protein